MNEEGFFVLKYLRKAVAENNFTLGYDDLAIRDRGKLHYYAPKLSAPAIGMYKLSAKERRGI